MKINIGPYEANRKVKIRIDPYDTYSADHTLALIIAPMLKQLKETNHGYPGSMTEKKWLKIQDKMIFAFEQIIKDDRLLWTPEEQKKVEKGLKLFAKHYMDLWD